MASKIQQAFLEKAVAPLRTCAERVRASRLRDALDAISRAKLENGLRDGWAALAAHSGAKVAALEAATPMAEVADSMARLEAAHRAAGEVFVQFLGQTVTLAPSTVEPRSAGAELRSVAARYALDRHISGPLESLAVELDAWETLLGSLAGKLAKDRSVVAARWRRWLVRVATALAVLVLASAAIAFFAWSRLVVRASQDRIAAALASPDPCVWETIVDKDLAHATPAQRADYESRKGKCAKQREREAYEARCAALADHVEAGVWDGTDAATAGASALLFQRVASRSLTAADLLIDGKAMPCPDARVAGRFADLFAKTAAGSSSLWGNTERVSPYVAGLLTRPGFGLTAESAEAQLAFSDGLAKRAIKTGHPDELVRASQICKVGPSLGLESGRGCAALARILAR